MTLAEVTERLIQQIVDKLAADYAPWQIILFGSYAYGTPNEQSDIDLLVIKETDLPSSKRAAEVFWAMVGIHSNIPVHPLVVTPDEMNRRLKKGDHFIEDIVEKGRSLYGTASWRKEDTGMPGEEPSYPMEWLMDAETDLPLVGLILDNEEYSYVAGYRLQQALEKLLKAFLMHNGWRLERTDNLVTLLDTALDYDAKLADYRPLCNQVSEYYYAERYPDSGLAGPGIAEVKENLALTQELVAKVREAITA